MELYLTRSRINLIKQKHRPYSIADSANDV